MTKRDGPAGKYVAQRRGERARARRIVGAVQEKSGSRAGDLEAARPARAAQPARGSPPRPRRAPRRRGGEQRVGRLKAAGHPERHASRASPGPRRSSRGHRGRRRATATERSRPSSRSGTPTARGARHDDRLGPRAWRAANADAAPDDRRLLGRDRLERGAEHGLVVESMRVEHGDRAACPPSSRRGGRPGRPRAPRRRPLAAK